MDSFKNINDTLGHDAGDVILKRVAHKLISSFRSSDIICRWGGEEFLIYPTDTDLDADNVSITVSQGISTWPSEDT